MFCQMVVKKSKFNKILIKEFRTSLVVIGLFLLNFLIHTTLRKDPFKSDESIYIYSAYAITRGDIPYRSIQLAQPPFIYLILALLINVGNLNLSFLRTFKSVMILLTTVLVYIVAKNSGLSHLRSNISLLSVAIHSYITIVYFYVTFMEVFITLSLLLLSLIHI